MQSTIYPNPALRMVILAPYQSPGFAINTSFMETFEEDKILKIVKSLLQVIKAHIQLLVFGANIETQSWPLHMKLSSSRQFG